MIICGLTGNIATGKSTVAKTLTKNHIPVVDADQVAREVVTPGTDGWFEVVAEFGKDYINPDDSLNRDKLGKLVFSNPDALEKLNKIMSPRITAAVESYFAWYGYFSFPIIAYDAPLLFETGNYKKYKPLILTTCSAENQLQRLMKRNSLTEEQALQRINAQLPVENKIPHVNYVINTDNSIEESVQQTEEIIKDILNDLERFL